MTQKETLFYMQRKTLEAKEDDLKRAIKSFEHSAKCVLDGEKYEQQAMIDLLQIKQIRAEIKSLNSFVDRLEMTEAFSSGEEKE